MAEDHGDPRPFGLDQVLRFRDLRAGDVVFNGETPAFLVIECDREANVFRWFGLMDGRVGDPNLNLMGMWQNALDTYSYVLRGDKELRCSRYSTRG